MRLPEEFPHTRREQYVLVLPVALLTGAERAIKQRVDRRFRLYARGLVAPFLADALSRGLTVREFATEFVATFEGPVPAAFRVE